MYVYALQDQTEHQLRLMLHLSPTEQVQFLGNLVADPRWQNLSFNDRERWLDQFQPSGTPLS